VFSDTTSNYISQKTINQETIKDISALINLGDYYKNNYSIVKANDVYKKALRLSTEINHQELMYQSYVRFGLLYERLANYKLSAENYIKALKIAVKLKDKKKEARVYNYLGNIFILEEDYEKAYEIFNKSLKIDSALNNKRGIAGTLNNIGEVYRNTKKYDKALKFYKKAIPINEEMDNYTWLAINLENIGSVYFKKNENKQALKYFYEALKNAVKSNDNEGVASIENNIGKVYLEENKLDSALQHLKVSFEKAEKISSPLYKKLSSYNLSEVYYKKGDYKKAYEYFKIYEKAENKLNENLKTKRIAQIVAEYNLEKKNKEYEILKKQKEFDDIKEKGLIIIVILIVIIAILIIARLVVKQKKTKELLEKNRQIIEVQKNLAKSELKNIELEKEKLSNEIEYQKKELLNFALHLVHKNDFLVNIKSELKKISSKDSSVNKQIRALLLKINQTQKINSELEEFQRNIERANEEFFNALNQEFPDLTKNEKRLAAMLRINLSSKEIATLNNISIKAVEMSRYRLRKKLNIGTNDSLNEFFQNIEKRIKEN
jgi:tetratricopeptide (TPR) repeat protein/DNA-binding CsgD family transcriptional regulator